MKQQVMNTLKKLTNHNFIKLTSRGNTAIFAALYCARKINNTKKTILVPDQGGWFSYFKYPKMLQLVVKKVKTDYGIIDITDLKQKSKDACAFIYSNPAGYFAEQPIKKIYDVCKKNNCLVILDITGSIGNVNDFGDFFVCSFGRWKPVNLGYGGFVSTNKKEYFEKPKEIFNTTSFDGKYFKPLLDKLLSLKQRYQLFEKINKKVKCDLKNFDVIHKEKRGINAIVNFLNEQEKEKIINYCKKHSLEYTLCPRYIRVNEKAISIEIKRLG